MGMTGMILTGAFVALGIYDILAAFRGGVNSTISRAMQTAGFRSPTVLFVLGGPWMLYGHSHGNLIDIGGKTIDVGVDCHNYRPISRGEVDAIMEMRENVSVDHH
jgi:hypothetical protein